MDEPLGGLGRRLPGLSTSGPGGASPRCILKLGLRRSHHPSGSLGLITVWSGLICETEVSQRPGNVPVFVTLYQRLLAGIRLLVRTSSSIQSFLGHKVWQGGWGGKSKSTLAKSPLEISIREREPCHATCNITVC
ncbi:hypothetical protein LZ30DRAFT_775691 [Colletotrichum cereale]|nr:hypothetical protein LZ30DRAFT_775691 [Colletotrichum cereale]